MRHRHHPGIRLRGSSGSGGVSAGSCLQAGSGVLQDLVARGVRGGTGSPLAAQLAGGRVPPRGLCARPCPGAGVPCLHQCLPVPMQGAQVSRLGHSQCWDMVHAGDTVSPQAMGHGLCQCHQRPWCHHRLWDMADATGGPGVTPGNGMSPAPQHQSWLVLASPEALVSL